MALDGAGIPALGSAVRAEASWEGYPAGKDEALGLFESTEQFQAQLGLQSPFLPSINQKLQVALLGSLPSQPDAQGGAGWGLSRVSCHYLTHCKLLFMNSGRKQSRESHYLVTTDILVRCSLHSVQARLRLPGTENPQQQWAAVPWPQLSASASETPLRAETQMEVGEVP